MCSSDPVRRTSQISSLIGMPTSLLSECQNTHEIYNEIDHIVSFAAQIWSHRNGGHGTRDTLVANKKVKVRVGKARQIPPGPHCVGGSATPPRVPSSMACFSSASWATPTKSGRISSRGAWSDRISTRLGPPARRVLSRPSRLDKTNEIVEEFLIDDFIIAESPTLLAMYRENHGNKEIGPLDRCARFFEAAIALCKLRWLLRLHYALVSLAGNKCSLHRLLVGILTDTCNEHKHPHSPLQVYELMIQSLHCRFQLEWPLFLAYVGANNLEDYFEVDCRPESRFAPRPFSAMSGDMTSLLPLPYQQPYHHMNYLGKDSQEKDSSAFLWQVIDDMFIAWLAQENSSLFVTESVLQELDFYGVPRPAIRTSLEGLQAWHQNKHAPEAKKHQRQAQRQAHHLAILLELPIARLQLSASDDDLLDLARDIVAHPKTFNVGVRSRVAMVLQGRQDLSYFEEDTCTVDFNEDQLSLYLSHCADPRDAGRLSPSKIEVFRENHAPWLHGREQRFLAAAAAWPLKCTSDFPVSRAISRRTSRPHSSLR